MYQERFRRYGWSGKQNNLLRATVLLHDFAGEPKKELIEYEDSLKNYRDWYSVLSTAIQKGIKKGIEEKGEKKKQLEIARNMISLGISPDIIAKATQLTLKEIAELNVSPPVNKKRNSKI